MGAGFEGDTQYLAIQLIRLVEQFLASDKLTIPAQWYAQAARRRLLMGLNIDAVVGHVSRYIRQSNTTHLEPLFDEQLPIGSTSDNVAAWAKNDHLDFVVRYRWQGSSRRFIPDFLIKLANGRTLVLEVKGQDSDRNRAKRAAMVEWVQTINQAGGFGQWCFDTVFDPAQTRDVIECHSENVVFS